jgi:predicted MPP superfamily phosphohydrolase
MPAVTRAVYGSRKLPEAFSGFRVVHISDLHSARFGARQEALLEKVRAERPDAILVTGDLIDRRRFDIAPAIEFAQGAARIAPVYYVPGNHEALCGRFDALSGRLSDAGVRVLADGAAWIVKGGAEIRILGLRDPAFYPGGGAEAAMRSLLSGWTGEEVFSLLLSHRPELLALYCACGVDLVFAGHAHGGQFRLPLIGGLYAPNQGVFPKYTSGSHTMGCTAMFVSRGLGNSLFPLRLFNPPEIVSVALQAQSE